MSNQLLEKISTADRGYVIEARGLRLTRSIDTEEQWEKIGREISEKHDYYQWALGDWINLNKGTFQKGEHGRFEGDKYDKAVKITGFSYHHIVSLAKTCEVFGAERREPRGLRFSFFRVGKHLPIERQAPMLTKAYKEGWTVDRFQQEAQKINEGREYSPAVKAKREAGKKAKHKVKCPNCQHVFPIHGNKYTGE
jgi:hypothetical protein